MSILLIGDKQFVAYLKVSLSNHNLKAVPTVSLNQAAELLETNFYKVIVCALPHGEHTNDSLLDYLKQNSPDSNIIFIADEICVSEAIELARTGLFTCIKKPFLIENLVEKVKDALDSHPGEKVSAEREIKKPAITHKYVSGVSQKAQEMYSQIRLVAPTNFNVIIYGETGTGKESVAQRLMAARGDNSPFAAVDCGCLSKELAGSELFGHEKGSFTGASTARKGAFEQAHNGTLFLDEIGNLDYEIQTYLLRVIQERKIRKVGGDKEIKINVRIVVASNENLAEKVVKGEFREDLYHRLNEFEISIPPLRERPEDLELFIDHFIHKSNSELNKNVLGVNDEAFKFLKNYDWPGNIRELQNIIRRACLLTTTDTFISKNELPEELVSSAPPLPHHVKINGDMDLKLRTTHYLKKMVENAELEQIMDVLRKVNFNKTKAASLLNIDRKTLYNKLKRYQ